MNLHFNSVLDFLNTIKLKTAMVITMRRLFDIRKLIHLGANHDYYTLVNKEEWDIMMYGENKLKD